MKTPPKFCWKKTRFKIDGNNYRYFYNVVQLFFFTQTKNVLLHYQVRQNLFVGCKVAVQELINLCFIFRWVWIKVCLSAFWAVFTGQVYENRSTVMKNKFNETEFFLILIYFFKNKIWGLYGWTWLWYDWNIEVTIEHCNFKKEYISLLPFPQIEIVISDSRQLTKGMNLQEFFWFMLTFHKIRWLFFVFQRFQFLEQQHYGSAGRAEDVEIKLKRHVQFCSFTMSIAWSAINNSTVFITRSR